MTFKEKYGEYALITGGSSGIGKAIALELAKRGINLILVARRKEELQQAQQEIEALHKVSVKFIQADLGAAEGISVIKSESEKYQVGLFVPAAGLEVNGAFEKNDIAKELKVVQLNIASVLELTHHFSRKLVSKRKGGILFVASLSGHMPNPYFANYAGTKAYIVNFAASLYGEFKSKGVDVTVLSPGLTSTPMSKDSGVDWSKTPMTAMAAADVAKIAVDALGNKLLAVPGGKNKVMATMAKFSPLQMLAVMNEKMMKAALQVSKL